MLARATHGRDELDRGIELIRSRRDVNELLAALEGPGWEKAAARHLRALTSADVVELLESVASDSSWLSEISSCSYTHDNGFEKIVLGTSPRAKMKLRLHVWHAAAQPGSAGPVGDLNYHNHRWSFVSRILIGGFRFSTYRPVVGDDAAEYEYRSPEGGKQYSIKRRGPASLIPEMDFQLHAGTTYFMDHEIIHRVTEPVHPCTATLLIQGPVMKDHTRVFSDHALSHGEEVEVAIIDSKRLTSFVGRVTTALRSPS